jgi:hypothetical protein
MVWEIDFFTASEGDCKALLIIIEYSLYIEITRQG